MKGKNNTYRPEVGEIFEISGPNCEDENGYFFSETTLLWKNEKFCLYGDNVCYPNLQRWEHIIAKPAVKNLYWREYLDINCTNGKFVVVTTEQMKIQANLHFKAANGNPPVFEPVMMTETEFINKPPFDGF